MPNPTDLRAVLQELVALKDLKDEESRLRQHRIVAIQREPSATAHVDALREDYNRRKPLAWAAARAALSAPDEAEQAVQEGFTRIDAAIADFSNPDSDCDPELLKAAERAIADPPVNAAAQELRSRESPLATETVSGPVAAAPNHLCEVNQFSSRACKRGTKGCTVEHAAPNTQEPER